MSRLSDRLFDAQAWRTNYVLERETKRTNQMLREIGWMLLEAMLVTAFLGCFR